MKNSVQLLDCTIRDGGFVNQWGFDNKIVRESYRALSQAGVDYVELGYRGRRDVSASSQSAGTWKRSNEEDIREAVRHISGAKLAIMGDQGKVDENDFCQARESVVTLIRIASHKTEIAEALLLLERLKKKGYQVSLNAMGYSNYSDGERREFSQRLKSADFLDFVYIADSYGSLFPGQIRPFFEPLLEIPHIRVGFHPHNNLQMSFANTLEAIHCGVHMVDCTIFGMGRAAGNLQTEVIVSYLEQDNPDRYNAIPLLNVIDRFYVALHQENPWGYQLPYMLSGMFQCHPDYAKGLLDHREFTIEDIWKVLDQIRRQPEAGRFSKEVLDKILGQGHIGTLSASSTTPTGSQKPQESPPIEKTSVPYKGRHLGKDFLILANGPTLKAYQPKIDQFISKYQPVVLGANYLGKMFVPHYHAFNNKRRMMEYVDLVSPESQLMLGQHIPTELINDYVERPYENVYYLDSLADFGIEDGVVMSNCRTISTLLLGVAIVMGARRVFAVGMDGYIHADGLHFYNEKNDLEDPGMKMEKHRWCQHYLKQIDAYLRQKDQEGLHILTPTSYKTYYKGIDNYF